MEHIYLVTYDIACPKRWRKVFKIMKGYGEWLQLSVFQCRLDKIQYLLMTDRLEELMDRSEDHILIVDIGSSDRVDMKVTSLGKAFHSLKREAIIV